MTPVKRSFIPQWGCDSQVENWYHNQALDCTLARERSRENVVHASLSSLSFVKPQIQSQVSSVNPKSAFLQSAFCCVYSPGREAKSTRLGVCLGLSGSELGGI